MTILQSLEVTYRVLDNWIMCKFDEKEWVSWWCRITLLAANFSILPAQSVFIPETTEIIHRAIHLRRGCALHTRSSPSSARSLQNPNLHILVELRVVSICQQALAYFLLQMEEPSTRFPIIPHTMFWILKDVLSATCMVAEEVKGKHLIRLRLWSLSMANLSSPWQNYNHKASSIGLCDNRPERQKASKWNNWFEQKTE